MSRMLLALLTIACLLFPLRGIANYGTDAGSASDTVSSTVHHFSPITAGSSDEARDHFVKQANTDLDKAGKQVADLRKQRDKLSKDSAQFARLDGQVNAMDHKIGEARDNVTALKKAPENSRVVYENRINGNLAQLNRMTMRTLAE